MDNIDLNTWIISDTHFGHYNMIKLSGRPLNFNEKIITQWIKHVKENDIILHLGDLTIFFGPTRHMWLNMTEMLPGKKYLIKGNHDKFSDFEYKMVGFEIFPEFTKTIDGKRICFSHQPQDIEDFPRDDYFALNLHGHMHGNTHHEYPFPLDRHMDVGVDVLGFAPVRLGDILEKN